jgi:hypothetical protein
MIHFACRCKHLFDLPDDMAGKQIQCPDCHRLVDVPSMDELSHLSDDGTIMVDAAPPASDPEKLEKLIRAFSGKHVDEDGVERDLRQTHEEFLLAGTEDHIDEFERHPTAPKYDPETGELIRPLDVAPDDRPPPHVAALPVASPALSYASPDLSGNYSVLVPFILLFSPVNLAAMLFVLLAHMFLIAATLSIYLVFGAIFVVGFGLVAHYGNVVEEVGIEERDEMPRFLRNFNLADDLWLPFVRIFLAWMICFGPGWIAFTTGAIVNWPWEVSLLSLVALDCIGLVFFPAIALITLTSGSLSNLHPMRIIGTIGKIGSRYAFLVIVYAIAFGVYMLGIFATCFHALNLIFGLGNVWISHFFPAYGFLFAGIILMHYFAWLLGMEYRIGHRKFPWVYLQFDRVIPGVNAPRYARPFRSPRLPRRAPAKPPAQ